MVKKRSPVKVASGNAGDVDTDGGAKKQKMDSDSDGAKKQNFTATDLLTKVDELVENFNYDLALQFSEKALSLEPQNTRALETMGNIYAELGNADSAKQYYMKAVALQPNDGHVKYLYLGQLSEGAEAIKFYNTAIDIMKRTVTEDESSGVSNRDISNVYCSLGELFMTDCCMEENAEQECEKACQQALQTDGENPEAYLGMCNFLLVKGNAEEAQNLSLKVYELWESLTKNNTDNDSIVELMSYESRMTLMKILIEVDLCDKVSDIGVQLLEENEDDIRIWYYMGLSMSLMKEVAGQRHYLETALFLYEKNGHADEDMLFHIKELLKDCPPEEDIAEEVEESSSTRGVKNDDGDPGGMDVDG